MAASPSPQRPERGIGHYLRDLMYGALDGCITTFAVVAGAEGATLGAHVVLILGVANLVADGISMAASNYLGLKSELEQSGSSLAKEKPMRHAAATFVAFVAVGAMPLLTFLAPLPWPHLAAAAVASAVLLFAVGAARHRFIPAKPAWRQGMEMLLVGVLAGGAAYAIGLLLRGFFTPA